MFHIYRILRVSLAAAAAMTVGVAFASVNTPFITSSLAPPQTVGTPVLFIFGATDTDPGAIHYRFRIRPSGGVFTTIRDFSPESHLTWPFAETDGIFEIEVTAKNSSTQSTATSSVSYTVAPVANQGVPVVTATSHPLVALYSAPACPAGSTMRVRFKLAADINWQATSAKNCNGSTTMNFYVGGMRATSNYQLRHDVFTGPRVTSGPILTFTTGAAGMTLPTVTQLRPLVSPTSSTEGVTLFMTLFSYAPFAVDSTGNVIWYSTMPTTYATRPAAGGTLLQLFGMYRDLGGSGFREVDLAGNTVKETNVERMNEQLATRGMHPVNVFHHEIRKLPNGNYLLLAQTERMSDLQGPQTDILGDVILVLDSNLQLLWAWDSFDHLDVSRKAVLGETCTFAPGCLTLNGNIANDWTHGNSLALTPDGNIVYSARHQDRVYKIAYANGAGDGHIIWMLGKDGDFKWNSSDPWPWQSHQHDVHYQSANVLELFDNGNTRVSSAGIGNSRGQVLAIDEVNMTVTPMMNADLGTYSSALGSSQLLTNGNHFFESGMAAGGRAQSVEVAPDGTIVSILQLNTSIYRAFRLRDLYSAE